MSSCRATNAKVVAPDASDEDILLVKKTAIEARLEVLKFFS